jgi:3-oxoadipate enol-lactonase
MEAVIASTLSRWFTSDTKLSRPDLIDRVTKTLLADDPMVHAAIWDKIADFDVHEQLREIRCPAIVLVGENDLSTPPSSAAVLADGNVFLSAMCCRLGKREMTISQGLT